jgi:hypothetical protein
MNTETEFYSLEEAMEMKIKGKGSIPAGEYERIKIDGGALLSWHAEKLGEVDA